MILDNQAKRSFSNADVNTIIGLFSAPDDRSQWALDKTARFVMFKVPFEYIVSPIIFDEIEETSERKTTPEYRAFPIQQGQLLKDGCELKEDDEKQAETTLGPLIKFERYIGNKWGGKYLRAPDIYHIIREKGGLVPLNRYAIARLGVTTGANEFFFIMRLSTGRYVTNVGGGEIEIALPDKFTRPVIRTVSECKGITFYASDTAWRILSLPKVTSDQEALGYIRLAERLGVPSRPFFRSKKCWYSLPFLPDDFIAVPEIVFARYFLLWNEDRSILNKNFYGFVPRNIDPYLLWGILNCSYSFLQFELSSRKPGAGASGISVDVANRMLVLSIDRIDEVEQKTLRSAGEKLRHAPIREVWDDVTSQERKNIDGIIYDALKLTQGERDAVYEAVIQLVEARLKKAGSV